MKNEQQRIWNKSELEAHPEWVLIQTVWENIRTKTIIANSMLNKPVQWCIDQGYTVTPEMIAKTEQPKTGTEILQKAIKQIDNMTPEEVQQRSKDRGIVIPDEPKTAIAANGAELVVGGRYRLGLGRKNYFLEILYIGKENIFLVDSDGDEYSWPIYKDYLPYTDPKEEPKPVEESWTKTMDLRWNATDIERLGGKVSFVGGFIPNKVSRTKTLQQKHISNLGNEKWVDVETVTI